MKMYVFLGLVLLSLSTYTLINPKHDNLLIPIMNITLAILFLKFGFSTLKGKDRSTGILILIVSSLMLIFTLVKLFSTNNKLHR